MQFVKQPFYPAFTGVNWTSIFEKCVNKGIEFIVLIDSVVEDTHGK